MTFKIANITRDIKILKQASIDSQEFIEKELYKNNPYYTQIVKSIKFID